MLSETSGDFLDASVHPARLQIISEAVNTKHKLVLPIISPKPNFGVVRGCETPEGCLFRSGSTSLVDVGFAQDLPDCSQNLVVRSQHFMLTGCFCPPQHSYLGGVRLDVGDVRDRSFGAWIAQHSRDLFTVSTMRDLISFKFWVAFKVSSYSHRRLLARLCISLRRY